MSIDIETRKIIEVGIDGYNFDRLCDYTDRPCIGISSITMDDTDFLYYEDFITSIVGYDSFKDILRLSKTYNDGIRFYKNDL